MVKSKIFFLFFLLFFQLSFAKQFYTLAVLSSEDPILEYKRYSALARYLSKKLNKPVKLQIVKKARRFLSLYQIGKIDIGIACPVVYFMANEKSKSIPISFLSINGTIFEAGVWVVRKDSNIKSIKDLKGKVLTLGSSICASNAIMPLYVLYKVGIKYKDLADLWSSGTDKGAILNVIAGFADAAGVNEESFKKYSKGKLRILIKTPYVPRLILFVKKDFPKQSKLKTLLISLNKESTLKKLNITGFVNVKDKDLKIIKDYKKILKLYPILK